MNSFSIASLLVFCALLGTATPYLCNFCVAANATECVASDMECMGDKCMTGSQRMRVGDKYFNSFYRGCANESLCSAHGSTTQNSDLYVRTYAKCCEGEKCNTDSFYIPEDDSTPNGVKCPSAYCTGSFDECKSEKEMECTGEEKQCMEYIGKVRLPDDTVEDYSIKGCINDAGCNHNFNVLIKVKEEERKKLQC